MSNEEEKITNENLKKLNHNLLANDLRGKN